MHSSKHTTNIHLNFGIPWVHSSNIQGNYPRDAGPVDQVNKVTMEHRLGKKEGYANDTGDV